MWQRAGWRGKARHLLVHQTRSFYHIVLERTHMLETINDHRLSLLKPSCAAAQRAAMLQDPLLFLCRGLEAQPITLYVLRLCSLHLNRQLYAEIYYKSTSPVTTKVQGTMCEDSWEHTRRVASDSPWKHVYLPSQTETMCLSVVRVVSGDMRSPGRSRAHRQAEVRRVSLHTAVA